MAGYQMSPRILGCPPIQTAQSKRCCLCNIRTPQNPYMNCNYMMVMPNQSQPIRTIYAPQQQLPQQYISPGYVGQQSYAYAPQYTGYDFCNCPTIAQQQAWYNERACYPVKPIVLQPKCSNQTFKQSSCHSNSRAGSIGSNSICNSQVEGLATQQSLNCSDNGCSLRVKWGSKAQKSQQVSIQDSQESLKQNLHCSHCKPVSRHLVIEEPIPSAGSDCFSLTEKQFSSEHVLTECQYKSQKRDLQRHQSSEKIRHKQKSHFNLSNSRPVCQNVVIEAPPSCRGSDFYDQIGFNQSATKCNQHSSQHSINKCDVKENQRCDGIKQTKSAKSMQFPSQHCLTEYRSEHNTKEKDVRDVQPDLRENQSTIKQNTPVRQNICNCKQVHPNFVVAGCVACRGCDFYSKIGLIKDLVKRNKCACQLRLNRSESLVDQSKSPPVTECQSEQDAVEREIMAVQRDLMEKRNAKQKRLQHDSCSCKSVHRSLTVRECVNCRGSDFYRRIGLIKEEPKCATKKSNFFKRFFTSTY